MFVYVVIAAIIGIALGLLFAIRTKKEQGITYGKLDRVGKITNIALTCAYAIAAPFCMFVGMICEPAHDGFLGVVGWIVSVIIASATMISGLGLGVSVAWRKKGKSKLSFAVQFAGVVAIGLSLLLFILFYGNLLATIN